ncbi:MAG: hypothetical protein R2777_04110 [Chitinophagales bacterium]
MKAALNAKEAWENTPWEERRHIFKSCRFIGIAL